MSSNTVINMLERAAKALPAKDALRLEIEQYLSDRAVFQRMAARAQAARAAKATKSAPANKPN